MNHLQPESKEHGHLVYTGVIQTVVTRQLFEPLDMSIKALKQIDYRDIARGCSNTCRFGGQVNEFYSVAQHMTTMARIHRAQGRIRLAKWDIIHDAAEGLGLCDMPRPIKYMEEMAGYRTIESATQYKIFRRYGLYGKVPKAVKQLDYSIVYSEAKQLLGGFIHPEWLAYEKEWKEKGLKIIPIKPYDSPAIAEREWLKEFRLLFEGSL
jgi:hypothetical protein